MQDYFFFKESGFALSGTDYMREIGSLPDRSKIRAFLPLSR